MSVIRAILEGRTATVKEHIKDVAFILLSCLLLLGVWKLITLQKATAYLKEGKYKETYSQRAGNNIFSEYVNEENGKRYLIIKPVGQTRFSVVEITN